MRWDPKSMWWVSGIVESVDMEQGTLSLWLEKEQFESSRTVALTNSIPQWMRYPGVTFSTHVPRYCLDEKSLENVVWGPFLCNGMEFWTELETFWQMGQIGKRVADRPYNEELGEYPARICARNLRLLIQDLLRLHQSNGWPTLNPDGPRSLEDSVQEFRSILVQAIRTLGCNYPALHALCESTLKSYAPENEDDFSGCSEVKKLNALISQLLDCEADTVILARLLMCVYPEQSNTFQFMIERYHEQTPSPIEMTGDMER